MLNVRLVIGLVAVAAFIAVVPACGSGGSSSGGGGGKYDARCSDMCDPANSKFTTSPDGCTTADKNACLTNCHSHVDALSQACANCIFDNSTEIISYSATCHQARWAPVSYDTCKSFCVNG